MSFTPLQELVLNHAYGLSDKLENQIYAIARKYEFATDMRKTPEHDLMETVRDLQAALNALLKERK